MADLEKKMEIFVSKIGKFLEWTIIILGIAVVGIQCARWLKWIP